MGGHLSPGSASIRGSSNGTGVGTLTIGSLSMMPSSTLDLDLGPPGIVGQGVNDLLVAHGDVNFNGILNLNYLQDFGEGTYTLVLFDGGATYNGLQLGLPLGLTQPFICPSETVTTSMSSTVLGSVRWIISCNSSPAARAVRAA